jgi:glycine/sarcosine N-methyltransferase
MRRKRANWKNNTGENRRCSSATANHLPEPLQIDMPETAQTYDDLAAHYDQIFENWEQSMARQAAVLGKILRSECGERRPVRVLDCACGIGTQSLGLAMNGFEVEGCDLSSAAIERARLEAAKRGLTIPFSVANMLELSAIPRSSFDAVICIDNSLPHLESDEQLLQAVKQAYGKLRAGGSFVGSIRDYDRLVVERPTIHGPSFFPDAGGKRIVFQVWDWLDERRYRFHLYITRSTEEAGWHTVHFTSTYRAVLRSELEDVLHRAGFSTVRWLMSPNSGFYQPIFIANRNSAANRNS